jgi:hypothetical protein
MTRRKDSQHDTGRETSASKRTIAVDTSSSDAPRARRDSCHPTRCRYAEARASKATAPSRGDEPGLT